MCVSVCCARTRDQVKCSLAQIVYGVYTYDYDDHSGEIEDVLKKDFPFSLDKERRL